MFDCGLGGNFLANFMSTKSELEPSFRVDWQQINPAIDMIGPRRLQEFDDAEWLKVIDAWVRKKDRHTMLTHYVKISNLLQYSDQCWIRKIVADNYMLSHAKNAYFKIKQLEQVNYETTLSVWVDEMLMYLSEFYRISLNDKDRPADYVIEYHKLYDIDFLTNLYIEINGAKPPQQKLVWAQEYINKQFPLLPYPKSTTMEGIVAEINPRDAFDVAACLFVYENNWKTIDRNRLWTIDDLPNDVDQAIEFLLKNQKNYKIF